MSHRLDDSEGHVSKLKYRVVEITQFEHLKGKKISQKIEDSLRHLVDNIKHTNIHIIGNQEEEREKDKISLEETMAENFPILLKETHSGPRSTESNTG